jgi:hypothetical protein
MDHTVEDFKLTVGLWVKSFLTTVANAAVFGELVIFHHVFFEIMRSCKCFVTGPAGVQLPPERRDLIILLE